MFKILLIVDAAQFFHGELCADFLPAPSQHDAAAGLLAARKEPANRRKTQDDSTGAGSFTTERG